MRAFVVIRQHLTLPQPDYATKTELRELREYMEEMFTDQNDINEDTRVQLELINQSLAVLTAQSNKPRNPIGFKATDKQT